MLHQPSPSQHIDLALWNLQGQRFGVPVYQLLGGLGRAKVVCSPHNSDRDAYQTSVGPIGNDGQVARFS